MCEEDEPLEDLSAWEEMTPEQQAAVEGLDDEDPLDYCDHCGKAFEDFSDLGCGYCDRRSPEWGILP